MKYFLVMNPRSQGGKSASKFESIFSRLEKAGIEYSYAVSSDFHEMLRLSRDANSKGFDVIVAVGGDGTINAVLNGFYDENGHKISEAAMAVLYTGTSPDFCKSYGIPVKPEEATELLIKHTTRNIRTMRISFRSNPGKTEEIRYYACCANIGLGASVARNSNELRKTTGDILGTLISLLKAIATYKARQFTLVTGDVRKELSGIINISVGRTRYIASGIKVERGMEDEDARCYLMIARKPTIRSLPSLLRQAYSGRIKETGVLSMGYGSEINISSDRETEVEFDGDPAGFTPCRISVAADPLVLITT